MERAGRLRAPHAAPPEPRTGGRWAHEALQRVWNDALERVGLPHISLYEGTKHTADCVEP